jgi:hypothetical protein
VSGFVETGVAFAHTQDIRPQTLDGRCYRSRPRTSRFRPIDVPTAKRNLLPRHCQIRLKKQQRRQGQEHVKPQYIGDRG